MFSFDVRTSACLVQMKLKTLIGLSTKLFKPEVKSVFIQAD